VKHILHTKFTLEHHDKYVLQQSSWWYSSRWY